MYDVRATGNVRRSSIHIEYFDDLEAASRYMIEANEAGDDLIHYVEEVSEAEVERRQQAFTDALETMAGDGQ